MLTTVLGGRKPHRQLTDEETGALKGSHTSKVTQRGGQSFLMPPSPTNLHGFLILSHCSHLLRA